MKNFTLKLFFSILIAVFVGSVSAQDVIDLSEVDNVDILSDTLPGVPDGAIVLLGPGKTYNTNGHQFDKSVNFKSSDPGSLDLPLLFCDENFNMAEGAAVDSVTFENIKFMGEFDSDYIFNIDKSATLGKFQLMSCQVKSLRGIMRMKGGEGTLDKFMICNSVIDSVNNYGILTVDKNTWMCNDIVIRNTTISQAIYFLQSRNNSNSVLIENCTLNEVPEKGRPMFRWREAGQDHIANGITIRNVIYSHGWNTSGGDDVAIDGFDGLDSTMWTFDNLFVSSKCSFTAGKDTIVGFTNLMYNGTAADLWVNPDADCFDIADTAFTGIGMVGDQRWAVATEDGGREWNISANWFNALGELDATKKVAGLTIYAHSGKKVKIDANNKTVDDMSFTHRLKFGGGGDFDDNGQPKGRVLGIDVMGDTEITVMAMSSSSSSDRVLNIAAGTKDNLIGEFPALGASLTKGTFTYTGGPTKIYFYSPSSGVNVYYLKTASIVTGNEYLSIEREDVNIYPNPADNRIFIDVKRPTQVGIYNIAGSLLKSQMVQSKHESIDISDLKQGMYFVRSLDSDAFAKKLIVR